MFHYDRGLWITAIGLAVDIPRQQKFGFVSHAHADHAARHELTLCTPATAALLEARYGRGRRRPIEVGEFADYGETKLSVFSAGHMLGSAMLLVEFRGESLLYTGDFRLAPSLTAGKATPPRADTLVMECTFGTPKWVFPPREEAVATLIGIIRTILGAGKVANVHAYAMGKSQELVRILTAAGFRVQVDKVIGSYCDAYRTLGVDLGDYGICGDGGAAPDVIISPPRKQQGFGIPKKDCRTIAATGWAIDPLLTRRWGVDYAVPLSDHADYHELIQLVETVRPKRVLCTHGTRTFAEDLRRRGWNAENLEPERLAKR